MVALAILDSTFFNMILCLISVRILKNGFLSNLCILLLFSNSLFLIDSNALFFMLIIAIMVGFVGAIVAQKQIERARKELALLR